MYTICLLGRSKIGKTSLFNKFLNLNFNLKLYNLFDFNYCIKNFNNKYFIFIDNIYIYNKILKNKLNDISYKKIYNRFFFNIINCDFIFFLLDSSIGLLDEDIFLYNKIIKKYRKKTILVLNKYDLIYNFKNLDSNNFLYKFSFLNIKNIIFISTLYDFNIDKLLNILYINVIKLNNNNLKFFNYLLKYCINLHNYNFCNFNSIKNNNNINNFKINIIILGKPNVGKSTLLNSICNDYRSFVSNIENITKSFIICNIIINNIKYIISDSPGINKNFFNNNYSIYDFNKDISLFNIIFFLIDINNGLTKYDLYLINFFLIKGKILFIIFNKCENLKVKDKFKIKNYIIKKYGFIKNIFIFFISALNISNKFIYKLFNLSYYSYKNIFLKDINTSKINKILKLAINKFNENNYFNNVFNLKYAHIGCYNPFTIVIHGNKIKNINYSYKKYLINFFVKFLNFSSYNINIKFKESLNPYNKK